MSRHSHVAAFGLLLVSCQKESVAHKNNAQTSNTTALATVSPNKTPAAPCAATNARGTFVPVGESGGSTLALLRFQSETGARTLALAADEDAKGLHVVDVDAQKPLGMVNLAGKPARVLALGDGRVVVSLGDVGQLEVLEPDSKTGFPFRRRCLVDTPADPMGLAVTNDQRTLLVTTRWEPTLSSFDASDMKPRFSLDLPRDPTSVIASADGKRAFVTHAAGGMMSVIDLEGTPDKPGVPVPQEKPIQSSDIRNLSMSMVKPMPQSEFAIPRKTSGRTTATHRRVASQGFVLARSEKGILAPLVMVEPKPPRGSSSGYGSDSSESPAVVGEIASVDEKTGEIRIKSRAVGVGPKDCFLPRAAVANDAQKEVWVSCLGIDSVIVYDASKTNPHDYEKRRIPVPSGPTGLAMDAEHQRAVVFSSFAGEMTFIHTEPTVSKEPPTTRRKAKHAKKKKNDEAPEVVSIVLAEHQGLSPEIALGRGLFHSAGQRNIALDGRACASCHPDGRDDGLTWQTQEGPRQTPILLGRLSTDSAPYGWLGDKKTLPSHFKRTLERLAGTGLKDTERDAIFAYVNSLSPPKSHKTTDEKRIARGKEIFESKETGCSSCHLGDATTDGSRHDVKSAQEFEADRRFETPSLRHIARSAPYFHDGRYGTLLEMIQGCDGNMGTTKHLAEMDRGSLAMYLETL